MFKNHPKGLLSASVINMGERFGFYTMMAVLVLFLLAKFGISATQAGYIYSIFYFLIYMLTFVGGIIADKTRKYKQTIFIGMLVMIFGYLIITIPTPTPSPHSTLFLIVVCAGLFFIAFGNGLFKGNLQALIGQMYDNPQYSKMRDSGFSIFYMFINFGSAAAPLVALAIRNGWLALHNMKYNADLPALCHGFLDGSISQEAQERFVTLAESCGGSASADLTLFANSYLNVFSTGFHYAFGAAIVSIIISLIFFVVNHKLLPDIKSRAAGANNISSEEKKMTIHEIRQRIYALIAVYGVVIFFWFSFHQNGLSLTLFAKDYTLLQIGSLDITTEIFLSINPLFVILLTPIVLTFFGWLRSMGKEPSTPLKIAIGMGFAALAYAIMAVCSVGLPDVNTVQTMGGLPAAQKVTPFLLIGTYLVLTIAELFISPLGISFVSKVAPPQYQGIMQGGWLAATALGNQLLFIGAICYEYLPLWLTWSVFVGVCLISMCVMFAMLGWLNRITRDASA